MSVEPPENLLSTDNDEDAVLTDATDASNLGDEEELPENLNLPEVSMQSDIDMLAAASEGVITMEEDTEMVEERLHDSLENRENHEQEEWLSEDVLTDDDFNSAADTGDSQTSQPENSQSETSPVADDIVEPDQSELVPKQTELIPEQTELIPEQTELIPEQTELVPELTELESQQTELQHELTELESMQTELESLQTELGPQQTRLEAEPVKIDIVSKEIEAEVPEQNIEDALNTLEGGPEKKTVIPDLDTFLIKKTEVKTEQTEAKKEVAKEQDDGNDTDDLLRMLGEDNNKSKKLTKTANDVRSSLRNLGSSDDDDFVFEGASAKKLKLSKLTKKVPPKADPEDMDDDVTDQSSDEAGTLKKMFNSKKSNEKSSKTQNGKPARSQKTPAKNIVNVVKKERLVTSTPLRQSRVRSLLKTPRTELKVSPHSSVKQEPNRIKQTASKATIKTSGILKSSAPVKRELKPEPEGVDEEFLDDDFHLPTEEFESDDEDAKSRQRIMQPERMDEDMPSDGDSHSEDGSLYDELPSSESEDADDWFQLDIRAEKAGDYLPLLGPKAKQMLLEEKQRVSARLSTLKQSLSALTDSGKKQADQVRTATMSLAELDDMLKAS